MDFRKARPLSAVPSRSPLSGGYGTWGSGPADAGVAAAPPHGGLRYGAGGAQAAAQRPRSALTRPGRHQHPQGSAPGGTIIVGKRTPSVTSKSRNNERSLDNLLFEGLFCPTYTSGAGSGRKVSAKAVNPYGSTAAGAAAGKPGVGAVLQGTAMSSSGAGGGQPGSSAGIATGKSSYPQGPSSKERPKSAHQWVPGGANHGSSATDLTKTLATIKQQIEREKARLQAPHKHGSYRTSAHKTGGGTAGGAAAATGPPSSGGGIAPAAGASDHWPRIQLGGGAGSRPAHAGGMKTRPQTAGHYGRGGSSSSSGGTAAHTKLLGATRGHNSSSSSGAGQDERTGAGARTTGSKRTDVLRYTHHGSGTAGGTNRDRTRPQSGVVRPTSGGYGAGGHGGTSNTVRDQVLLKQQQRPKTAGAAGRTMADRADLVDRSGKQIPSSLLERGYYVTGKTIGQGAYASVRVCTHFPTEKAFAVKIFDKTRSHWDNRKKLVYREVKLMEKICRDNPHICKFFEYVDQSNFLHLFIELVNGGNLRQELNKRQLRRISEGTTRHYFWQICDGIEYLHQNLVVHRDIKLENLLLHHSNDRVTVKIVDFGFAVKLQTPCQKLKVFCGTPSYMSPEIVAGKEYSGFQSDVWALGVVLYVLLCGRFPFKANQEHELYHKIRRGSFSLADNHISPTAKRVIKGILRVDASLRPVVSQIVHHAWVLQGAPSSHPHHQHQTMSGSSSSSSSSSRPASTHSNGGQATMNASAAASRRDDVHGVAAKSRLPRSASAALSTGSAGEHGQPGTTQDHEQHPSSLSVGGAAEPGETLSLGSCPQLEEVGREPSRLDGMSLTRDGGGSTMNKFLNTGVLGRTNAAGGVQKDFNQEQPDDSQYSGTNTPVEHVSVGEISRG